MSESKKRSIEESNESNTINSNVSNSIKGSDVSNSINSNVSNSIENESVSNNTKKIKPMTFAKSADIMIRINNLIKDRAAKAEAKAKARAEDDPLSRLDRIIDEKKKNFSVDDVIVYNLSQRQGKFKNLDEALTLLNGTGDIDNFGDYIKNKTDVNDFLTRVISRSESQYSESASQVMLDGDSTISFESEMTGKYYTNGPDIGFFEYMYNFWLDREKCYITYEQKDDGTIYIDMISCEPNSAAKPFPNRSEKGSGRLMIYDLVHFVKQKRFGRGIKYTDKTRVCLTPEPSTGGREYTDPSKLYDYYSAMGFIPIEEGSHDWCGSIDEITKKIGKIAGITTKLYTRKYEEDEGGGRGRRKHKKTKSRKSRKSRKRRK